MIVGGVSPESIASGGAGLRKSVTRRGDRADQARSHECERCTQECATPLSGINLVMARAMRAMALSGLFARRCVVSTGWV